jgi:DNA helicase-2/ATP-dependent DNA helicase PcrA
MFPLLDRLNEQQRRASTSAAPQLRILAGAGTGKTTTLTARVAWLVASGVPADRIMLVTFTRRAAREMVRRTDAALATLPDGRAGTGGRVRAGTFHSIAHRTLRRHAASLGLPEGFSVLDPGDAADLIDMVRHEHLQQRTTERRFPRKATLLDLYSRAVNTQRPLSDVVAEVAPWSADRLEPIAEICRAYVARKRTLGLLDFDDLLLHWRAAARDERLGAVLAAELDQVCVDEYQDVNALQVDLLAALCSPERAPTPGLTVVGDDSQAVYSFRGSSPRHLLDIATVFPGVETITLERNYRSTQPILDVANAVGEDAPEGFSTRLRSVSGDGTPPELVTCADEDAEVAAVCDRILAHREEGVDLQQQAVLVRAAHHSALLELELSRRRIPYVKYGGLKFLEAAHVKDLICLFRLADNPRDELSWFRLLQLLEGVGPASAQRTIAALGLERSGTPGAVLDRWPDAVACLPASARPIADGLVDALRRAPAEPTGAHAERLVEAITPLVERAYEDAAVRLVDLDTISAAASDQVRVSDVAADLTLEPPHSAGDLAGPPLIDEDWLVISTIHSAKGLEWDVVHLLRASDGNLPSDMALSDREGLEEERRLFYVAVTRPARALHVYHPLRYHHRPRGRDDAHSYGQPSRFLSDRVQAAMVRSHAGAPEPIVLSERPTATTVELELDALWQ